MSAKVTIIDVARAANVAPSTVTRALTPPHQGVSKNTQNRILRIANQLGYSPNRLAQGLVSGAYPALGVILPDLRNPYPVEVAENLEKSLEQIGYETWLMFCRNDPARLEAHIQTCLDHRVSGIVIFPSDFSDCPPIIYRELMSKSVPDIPVILVAERYLSLSRYVVSGDNYLGAKMAVEHLVALGHKRIALLSGSHTNSSLKERYEGYVAGMQEQGLDIDEASICTNIPRVDQIYTERTIRSLLNNACRPTAMIVCAGYMAMIALKTLNEMKLHVPEDMSVIGFDRLWLTELMSHPLTTIEFPIDQTIEHIVNILQDWKMHKGPIDDYDIRVPPRLHQGRTTAAPREK